MDTYKITEVEVEIDACHRDVGLSDERVTECYNQAAKYYFGDDCECTVSIQNVYGMHTKVKLITDDPTLVLDGTSIEAMSLIEKAERLSTD